MSDLITNTIKESPLFKHLTQEELENLIGKSVLTTFQSGAIVIKENTQTQNLYIVISGRVRVWTTGPKGEVDLKAMGPGAYFGEVSLLSGSVATASVEVTTGPAQFVAIDKETIHELLENDDKVRKMLQGVTLARAKDTITKVFK